VLRVQPQTNSLAHGGSEVEYTYRVVRPLTAILTKVPVCSRASRGDQPARAADAEESSRVWMVMP